MWPYNTLRHSLMAQRCENYVVVSLVCIWDVWAPPKAWHSIGLELCGWHRDGHCHIAGRCHQLFYAGIHSWSWYMGFDVFDNNGLRWLFCYVIWSPEVRVPQCQRTQHHFTSRCLWLTCVWSRVWSIRRQWWHCVMLSGFVGSLFHLTTVTNHLLSACLTRITSTCKEQFG